MKKSELNGYHIVKYRNGSENVWKSMYGSHWNDDLKHYFNNEYDIIEVWEFCNLAWQRKEEE